MSLSRAFSGPRSASSSAVVSTPSFWRAQAARSVRARLSTDLRLASVFVDRAEGALRARFELSGERLALVLFVGDFFEKGLDLGTHQGLEFFDVDDRAQAIGGPGGEAFAVVARGVAGRAVGHVAGEGDADGELRFLEGVVLAGFLLEGLGHLVAAEAFPGLVVEGDAELVLEPAGQGAAAPVGFEVVAGVGEVDLADGLPRPFR